MIEFYFTILILIINYYPNIISVINSSNQINLTSTLPGNRMRGTMADSTSVVLHKTVHSIHANAAVHLDVPLVGSTKSSFRTAEPRKPKNEGWASTTDG